MYGFETHFCLVVALKDGGVMPGVLQVLCWLLLGIRVGEMVPGDCMVEGECTRT